MDRRTVLKSLASAAGACAWSARLGAEVHCADSPFGVRTCQAGIDSARMDSVYVPQRQSEWCWAACLEMVFAYYGHRVPQAEIVRQTWGQVANVPGQPYQIVQDLNRPWTDKNGDNFQVRGDVFSANAVTAAQDLANDFPLILGSLAHAMVLTAITYQGVPNVYGAGTVVGATVRDPWPGRGKRALTPAEYAGAMLLVRIRVS
ncbi:MAG TPA: papain-like cysteine protease family protein [Bryobacteraceae bacterium]|nr:papain-like cysteine protease family protein [Bryobacteraceae bacterium]